MNDECSLPTTLEQLGLVLYFTVVELITLLAIIAFASVPPLVQDLRRIQQPEQDLPPSYSSVMLDHVV